MRYYGEVEGPKSVEDPDLSARSSGGAPSGINDAPYGKPCPDQPAWGMFPNVAVPMRMLGERRFDPPRPVLVEHGGLVVARHAGRLAAVRRRPRVASGRRARHGA